MQGFITGEDIFWEINNLLKTVNMIVWNACDGAVLWMVLKRPCGVKLMINNSAALFIDFFVQYSMKIVWQNNKPVHILEIIVSYTNLLVTEDYIIERLLVFFFDI